MKKTQWMILLSLLVVGIAMVATSMLPEATNYYLTVDELLANPPRYQGREVKVAGHVIEGSIEHAPQSISWQFEVENNAQVVAVSYQGAMPDTFKDGVEVVATGYFDQEKGVFVANHVLAKCASRYEEKIQPKMQADVPLAERS